MVGPEKNNPETKGIQLVSEAPVYSPRNNLADSLGLVGGLFGVALSVSGIWMFHQTMSLSLFYYGTEIVFGGVAGYLVGKGLAWAVGRIRTG